MLPFYILTHRKVGYFARGCPTIWKSSIVPPWSLQDGGTTCSDGWAINVTTGPCIDKYVQRYNALAINMHYHWKHKFLNGCIGILYSWMCMCIAAPRLSGHMMGETWLFLQERDSAKIIFISSFFIPCHFPQIYAKMICLWQHQKQMPTCKNLHISLPEPASCKISVFHWTKFGTQGKVLSAIDIISFNRIWSQVSTQTLLCIFDMLIHPVGVVMVITPIFTPSKV